MMHPTPTPEDDEEYETGVLTMKLIKIHVGGVGENI
jgi:hypothetical protein